jgi:tetratricopeptide (TPR) repeat protein
MPIEKAIMKWVMCILLALMVGGSWLVFSSKGRQMDKLQEEIIKVEEAGDPDSKLAGMESDLRSLEGERTFSGILLTFLGAGLAGILFVVYLLPFFAQRATHAIYDSAEMIEKDVMHDARVLVAQGDYHGAIEAFKEAAKMDPLNRLPWVEIAKIQKDNLEDPHAAIETIRYALESQEWEINDAAYFLFRLAELYDEILGDRESAASIMRQVIENFPRTRHSANAQTKLYEWGMDDASIAQASAPVVPPPPMAMDEPHRHELPPVEDEGTDRPA